MSELSIAISIAGLFGSISSIVFAYLAFKRNETNDAKEQGENTGEIQADIQYIVKMLSTLEQSLVKLEDKELQMLERLAKVEQCLTMLQQERRDKQWK